MRISSLSAALAAGTLAALAVPGPASAQTTGNTPVTIEVTGGALNINVPTGPVNLGSVTSGANPQTVSAQLGDVTVTDDRDGATGWTVTANGVDFTGPQSISVSAAGSSSYVPGPIGTTGTVTATGSTLTPLYPPGPVVTATGVSGLNTATWDPTISVTVPGGALTGTYTSTITHDVS
jgi:hypothetical protein